MDMRIPSRNSLKILSLFSWVQSECPYASGEFNELLSSAKDGIEVEIRPLKYGHTRQQDNYYRKWCRKFGDYCGMTPDEMHSEVLCTAYGSEEVHTKFGFMRRPLKRSGEAKRGDYSHLIDTLVRVSAEMGFDIPPPSR